ncbi:MAG: TIGR01212 family radical SAM protein [Acidobacteria bacterium]|nr:MAG: TIGR01212 family radical SAM protein [Acidobacteriota bacterium]
MCFWTAGINITDQETYLQKPYLTYRAFLQQKYSQRIQKISIDAGFSCPNRDGSKGKGGCTYCVPRSFTPAYVQAVQSVSEQLEKGKVLLRKRYKPDAYIAYFQSFSNTYAELSKLKELYLEALADREVVGLAIGTRPDCVDDEKLDFIAGLSQQYDVTIEYGLESSHNITLERINRKDTVESFKRAVNSTAKRGIQVGAHVILGLPGETRKMMMETARFLAGLPIQFVKIHHLHLVKGTLLAKEYRNNSFPLFSLNDYLDHAAEFIRNLRHDMVLQRVVGETHPRHLVGPNWGLRSYEVASRLEEMMIQKGWRQGDLFPHNP